MKRSLYWSFLIGIVVLGAFFRFYNLDSIPPGLYPDEAIKGNEGWQAANNGDFKIFYPDNNGREGLWINLIGIFLKIFGHDIVSIRLLPALIGTLTILAIWLLTKELFTQERIALWSSFFLATGFWHINFSRIGFRAILVPFLLSLTFGFLLKGLKTNKFWPFVLAGISFGIGFHTYIAFRFIPLLLIIFLLAWWWQEKGSLKPSGCSLCFKVLLFLAVTFIVALPIGLYFLQNPQDFFGRATDVSIFSSSNPLKAFVWSTVKTLGQFNIVGDHNWRHNYSGRPELLIPVGIFFLIGLLSTIKRLLKRIPDQTQPLSTHAFLLSGFLIMMLPSSLTSEGVPHALRTIGMIPFAMIFAGVGFEAFYQWLLSLQKRGMALLSIKITMVVIIIAIASFEFHKYFLNWAKRNEVKDAFSNYFVQIGRELKTQPADFTKYVIVNQGGVLVNGVPMPAQTVIFEAHDTPNVVYINEDQIPSIKLDDKSVIIPLHFNKEIQKEMENIFGKIFIRTTLNNVFVVSLPNDK
ncbi:phospholipid carrier-dependent glycosyltransferase [Candidatus Parcubacteria bacterium]|nr:MAG: phospholipid carrier-dependent glycosyltransferase [Candidatus Parcubacteria bacterium]